MEAGEIYWLLGDFKILNEEDPDVWYSSAKIESFIIGSNIIRFHTEVDKNISGFTINLLATRDDYYHGKAVISESGEDSAEVKCEIFENKSRYLLKGTWIESNDDGESFYTWFAILSKKRS